MAILLVTDFGAADPYVGQVEVVLDRYAPGVRVIRLLDDAPSFEIAASAHLLAALATRIPRGHVILGVVDPGVGSDRGAVVMRADGRWYVGPDNGLFSVVAARSASLSVWRITGERTDASLSFHGRDIFAPMAAAVATDDFPNENVKPADDLAVRLPAEDLSEVVFVDHYGNAFTGLRASGLSLDRRLMAGGREIAHARVFADAPAAAPFWYENSIGLVEIAMNRGHAARELSLVVTSPVAWAG